MTSDQQFLIQMATIIIAAVLTLAGMVVTYLKSNQAALQSVAATQTAAASVAVSVDNGKKSDTIIEKATEIHTLTNSNLSKVTASLDVALARIDGLTALVATMTDAKVVADNLAERAAPPPAIATISAAPSPVPVEIVATVPVPVDDVGARADRPRRRG